MEYKKSKHCVYNINYHIVFCPKRRKPVLVDDITTALQVIITDRMQSVKAQIISLTIHPDSVHLFVSCSPTLSPHKIVKIIKNASANTLRERFPQLRKIPAMWSSSYYAGTVGFASDSVVKSYIENQKGK
jgi:putative transposase